MSANEDDGSPAATSGRGLPTGQRKARAAVVEGDVGPVAADGLPDRVGGLLLLPTIDPRRDPVAEGEGVPAELFPGASDAAA